MSYIDETYGKQLEEALRGLVSRPALGQPWFGFHASEVPAGVLLFTATTHSRVLYADFWEYIQDKNLVKTEEEWQSIYSEQGWCPFYSDGDGIDTFRMPSAPLYLHGANTLGEAGKYIKEGLPNITGSFMVDPFIRNGVGVHSQTGAFFETRNNSGTFASYGDSGSITNVTVANFDASRSSVIYGASDHVTPETSKMLFGIWAISAPQQPIPDATVEGIISELGVASNNALEAKNSLSKAMPVGMVVAFASNSDPEGYLLCNGAAVSRTTYAALFGVVGTTYGAGDGSTTFNLPNLTDRFIQGSGTAGTVKEAGLPNITGAFRLEGTENGAGTAYANGAFAITGYSGSMARNHTQSAKNPVIELNASRSSSIYGSSITVQPPALTMRYYIKY